MKKTVAILVLSVVLYMSIPSVYAGVDNLTADVGSYYITWEWDYTEGTTNCSIWIDGSETVETFLETYTLSNLNPRESHSIALVNTSNESDIYATGTARTFYPPLMFYFLLIFSLGFFILTLFGETLTAIITGVLGFILGVTSFRFAYPLHFDILAYLCLGVAVLCLLLVFYYSFGMLRMKKEEEEWELIE